MKLTVEPTGMALPFTSTTVTGNVNGAPATPAAQGGSTRGAPPLMVMLAVELENTITCELRTSMVLEAAQVPAELPAGGGVALSHNTPLYFPSGPS